MMWKAGRYSAYVLLLHLAKTHTLGNLTHSFTIKISQSQQSKDKTMHLWGCPFGFFTALPHKAAMHALFCVFIPAGHVCLPGVLIKTHVTKPPTEQENK